MTQNPEPKKDKVEHPPEDFGALFDDLMSAGIDVDATNVTSSSPGSTTPAPAAISSPAIPQKSPDEYAADILKELKVTDINNLYTILNNGNEKWHQFNSLDKYIQAEIVRLGGQNIIYQIPGQIRTVATAIETINTFLNSAIPDEPIYADLRGALMDIRDHLTNAASAAPAAATAPAASTAGGTSPAGGGAAPASNPKGGVAPATTPVLATGFETFDVDLFLNTLNFNNTPNLQVLKNKVLSAVLKIEAIDIALGRVCKQHNIPSLSLNTNVPPTDIDVYLGDIISDCRTFLKGLKNSLASKDRDNIDDTVFTIIKIARGLSDKYLTELARLNPPTSPAVAPTVVGGGGARTPGAPAVDTAALKRQMNSDWANVERGLRSEYSNYELKKTALETFISNLRSGMCGDPTIVPASTKILETVDVLDKAESVVNEMNFNADIKSTDVLTSAVNRLVKKAKDANDTKEILEAEAAAKLLRKDFRMTVNQARKIKVPKEEETKPGSGKYKTVYREINLGQNPLVYYILFGDMFNAIEDGLNDAFFEEQKKRIKDYEKSVGDINEVAKVVDVIKALDAKIIATAKVDITKKGWEDFLVIFTRQIKETQENIDAKISSIAKIVGGDTDKIKKYANKKRDEIVVAVSELRKSYDMTKLPSGAPRGSSSGTIWRDVYKKIEGVTNADGSVKYSAPNFISGINITVPTLEMTQGQASPTSPTQRGSRNPYPAGDASNGSLNNAWERASRWKRAGIVVGAAAVAAVLAAAALSVKKSDKEPDTKPKTVATAPADATAAPRNSSALSAQSTGSANNLNGRGVEASGSSAAVARMSSAQVLGRIEIRDGESFTFAGEDMLNSGNYNSIKLAGSGPNANAEGVLKYNILAQLVSDMSSAPADNDYSVSRIRLLRFVLSEDTNFKPKNITAASSTAALAYWALDTSREAEKFVIYFYKNKNKKTETAIYLRGDAGWRKAIEDTVRGHMVSGSSYDNPGILTDDDMDKLFNNTTTQKRWDVLEQAQSNGTLADIMKNKKEYFVKNK